MQIQFHFQSTTLSTEQLKYLEEEMTQQYKYVSEEEIKEKMREAEEEMSYIVPEKEVTVEDYVSELPNILRARSRYLIQSLLYQGEESKR